MTQIKFEEFFTHMDEDGYWIDIYGKRWCLSSLKYHFGDDNPSEKITMVGNNKIWEELDVKTSS